MSRDRSPPRKAIRREKKQLQGKSNNQRVRADGELMTVMGSLLYAEGFVEVSDEINEECKFEGV